MSKRFPIEDTLPWYQQFWPWFIMALPASVVVAGLTTLYIANRYSDDLVVDEYYKNGLAINRQLEKKQRAAELGIGASLQLSAQSISVQMSGPMNVGSLRLFLSHPLESDQDFQITLKRVAEGTYQGVLPTPVAPRWHWILEPAGPDDWRLDGSVVVADFSSSLTY